MPKIITKKQRLEKYIKNAVLCNVSKKSKHCLNNCFHEKLHTKESSKDSCHSNPEFCSLSLSGIVKVVCKSLTKKKQREWVKNESKS